MIMTLYTQIRLLVFNVVTGLMIGLLFDIYRLIRGDIYSKVVAALEDIIFWILSAFIVFSFMMYTNSAFMSIYVLLLIIFGVYIYMCLISKLSSKVIKAAAGFIFKLFRVIINILIYPLQIALMKKKSKKH